MVHPSIILTELSPADVERYGAKAAGLMRLPSTWVPEFGVLAARPTNEFTRRQRLLADVEQVLSSFRTVQRGGSVDVRSSAPLESLSERGRLLSYTTRATPEEVCDAAARIADHALSVSVDNLAIIVQLHVHPTALGHLSNERRVSKSETQWLLEEHWPVSRDVPIRPRKGALPDPDRPLARTTIGEPPELTLEQVAGALIRSDSRFHLEWASDTTAVWIVQCDGEVASELPAPCSSWFDEEHTPEPASSYRLLHAAADADRADLHKASHVRLFHELGLPHGDVLLLDDRDAISGLALGEVTDDIQSDITTLVRWPVVIRTDVSSDEEGLLLPHSDALDTSDSVIRFLIETARARPADVERGALAFLMHRFVAARVGAFAYARPDISRVRIDATWGVPDSLLFHSHDTYEVDLTDPDRVRPRVRCKGYFVDVDASGRWIEREAGWSWDWRNALTPDQVRSIAAMTHQVANALEGRVQVMFFVGLAPGSAHPDVLPWFVQADNEFDPSQTVFGTDSYSSERMVRSEQDLDALDRDLSLQATSTDGTLLVLRPTPSLLRSSPFLEAVAEVATRWRLPVLLEGSVLSHAFYVLRRAGVVVRERRHLMGESSPQLPLNKLVRDRIPEMVRERSEDVEVVTVTGDDLTQLLTVKAVEEAFELAYASGEDATLDELSDLFEVVRAVGRRFGLTVDQVAQIADEKSAARGGFEDGQVLLSTRQRLLGEAGQREQTSHSPSPGRTPPFFTFGEAGPPTLHLPVRGVGLPAPVRLRHTMPSGVTLEAVVRYGIDGIDVTLSEHTPEPTPNQLSFDI